MFPCERQMDPKWGKDVRARAQEVEGGTRISGIVFHYSAGHRGIGCLEILRLPLAFY